MPNYVAVGSEFVVNNVTLNTQARPDFAKLAGGRFVAVWESSDAQLDASSGGIKGRVMGPDGVAIGPEFLINTATASAQTYPSVAGLADGGFVVTWTTRDPLQDGNYDSIKAQRFDASGVKIGPEFLVNSQTANIQWISSVAELDTGGFVIAWETYDGAQDGSGRAIKAQIYDASGARVGGELLVNTVTASDQMNGDISTLSGGRFVVTWLINIGGKLDVRAQVFDSSGAKLGGEIFVNSQTFESQTEVAVTNLAGGGFVITWTTFDPAQDGSGYAIKAQLFDAAGAKLGGEFLVNAATAASQKTPTVAGLSNGDFVIAWRTDDQSADDASGAIKAQVFSATGARIGGEFKVNTAAASLEVEPTIVDLGNGAFAIGWTGGGSPSWDNNIKAQIFSSGSAPVIRSNGGGDGAALLIAEGETAVTIVQAFDLDGPATTYSIAGGADAALFAIDPASGALRFVSAPDFGAPLDADANNVYEVMVRASDGERSDEQALSVAIASVNSAPSIVSDGGGASAAIDVPEGATQVTNVSATDGDGDPPAYAIVGGADAARFTIDAATGALAFAAAPDREAPSDADGDNVYEVVVRASDGSLFDTQALSVRVGNVNEAPTIHFFGWPASEEIISSTPEGWADYGAFAAVDRDGDALSWTLSGEDAGLFTFDAASGRLRFNFVPDFEAPASSRGTNSYRVTLNVSDGSLGDSVAVTIHIRDVNEGLAIQSNGGGDAAAVSVEEGSAAVASVSAVDRDGDAVVYSVAGGADAELFAIDAATGALSFRSAPDFEAPGDADGDNVYDVHVAASDGSFTDTQSIAVTVANRNEGIFIESNGGGTSASISMSEGQRIVTTVAARDPDGTAPIYSIRGGPDAERFAIDPVTGVLSFVETPDYEVPADQAGENFYTVEVQASDGELTSWQKIQIRIGNVNEGVAITSSASVGALENGTAVATVAARDQDGDPVTYAIAGGADAGLFAIDAQTGALRFVQAPNFEAAADEEGDNVYDVIVSASDGSFSAIQAISIRVANVNEGLSITSNGGGAGAAVTLAENGASVTTVAASDLDGDAPTYAIVGGADAARFAIDPATGALRFVAAPNYEAPADADGNNKYEVVVSASDGTFTDIQALSVTVTNVNEGNTIYGTSGGDTISASTSPFGQPRATELEDTVHAMGGNDTISTGGGADIIDGGAGNDWITGGLGADRLTGGTGSDRFIYSLVSESAPNAPDVITDFSRSQGDRINLSGIDANTRSSGNQSFAFIGGAAFSSRPGELRFEQIGGNTFVSGDVDGNGVADFLIQLNGIVALTGTDFVL